MGVYDKYANHDGRRFTDPKWRDYYRRVFTLLQAHNLNTIVSPYLCDAEDIIDFVELAASYDIAVVLRSNPEGCLRPTPEHLVHEAYGHPSVIAFMYGDEPAEADVERYRRNYEHLATYYPDKPVVTAMVGEDVEENGGFPVRVWEELDPQVRMIRFYPFRYNKYNLVDWFDGPEGFGVAPDQAFHIIEQANGQTPWWYVPQVFGQPAYGAGMNYPTPQDIRALTHTALANGARALLGFSLQNEQGPVFWRALVNQALESEGDNLAMYGELAGIFRKHSDLLLRHLPAEFDIDNNCNACSAVARYDPHTGEQYVYLVNRDSVTAHVSSLTIDVALVEQIQDIYSGQAYDIRMTDGRPTITVTLEPGEGQFLRLTTASQKTYLPYVSHLEAILFPS
ncbi:MAG: hypothetical protein HC893_07920 [Chloroflexaceae bacterium]|nr:hypothetical protein [Chloroflexaceae bacterium]